jgi:O-antigen/teichoic acid export membrane protein
VVRQNLFVSVLFVVFCAVAAANYIVESVFVAYRSSRYILVKNMLSSVLKLPLAFALVFAGAFGIYSSWIGSLVVAVLFGLWIVRHRFQHRLALTFGLTPTPGMRAFSLANYLATLAEGMPAIVLPLLVLDLLGAMPSAHYYMAMMLASVLFAVSAAAGQALFAEGSHSSEELRRHTRKAVVSMALLLVPGILATVFIGPLVLRLFGSGYERSAHGLLIILALSAVLVAANDSLRAIHKVRLRNAVMLASSALGSAAAVVLCFLLSGDELLGIGFAWCGGQLVTFLILAVPLAHALRRADRS